MPELVDMHVRLFDEDQDGSEESEDDSDESDESDNDSIVSDIGEAGARVQLLSFLVIYVI
jgi:hypothetical protein